MNYLAIGFFGFIVIHLSEWAAVKRLALAKPLAWGVGMALIGYALVMASLWPDKQSFPFWSTWFGWALFSVSIVLVVYALFINLPFHKTYVASGVGEELVTSGFYALTRHPGVMWFAMLAFSLLLVSKSQLMLVTAPLFVLLDTAAVIVEDRFFFPRMFAGYDEYRRRTPMLIPTRKSISAFLAWLRHSGRMRPKEIVSKRKEATHVHLS